MSGGEGLPIYKTNDGKHIDRGFFVIFKKHFCKQCGDRLNISWITQIIKKDTSEAKGKNIRFDIFGHPVKYTFAFFECTNCGNKLSINDQYFLEKPHKLNKYNLRNGDYRLKDDYYVYLKSLER